MKYLSALVFVLLLTGVSFANIVYSQDFDHTGNSYNSQNDPLFYGVFVQVYDNFTLGESNTINEVFLTGNYFAPPEGGLATGWTIQFYADTAGQPGSLLSTVHFNDNGNETFIGNVGGFPTYTYDIAGLNFTAQAGVQYWLSVYPDVQFPPQWGWASATGGDGISYQDFFGIRSQLDADMAFTLIGGNVGTPEPGSLMLLGAGLLGLGGLIRRK